MTEEFSIYKYIKTLSHKNMDLLNDYIKLEYVSGIRTGKGKRRNFFEEHNSPEGIKVVKEILKFKRLEKRIEKKEELLRKKQK